MCDAYRAPALIEAVKSKQYIQGKQHGIMVRPSRSSCLSVAADMDFPHEPTWLGISVAGDERIKGPVHNYARLLTWWQLASILHSGMETTFKNIRDSKPCTLANPSPDWDDLVFERYLIGDNGSTQAYCGMDTANSVRIFADWRDIPAFVYQRMLIASAAAIFLCWGTTGRSFTIKTSSFVRDSHRIQSDCSQVRQCG